MTTLQAGFGERWVATLQATFADAAAALGDLDRQSGDGDFGTNITSAFARARGEAEEAQPSTYPEWLTAVSRGFLGTGGTSGPLYGMFFRELARCTDGDEPSLAELSAGFAAGLATVQRYGKAKVGHKTMVDALSLAVDALEGSSDENDPAEALGAAADAAQEGARSTAEITARRGRAAYVGEVSRGVLDPGAVAMALVIRGAAQAAGGSTDAVDASWMQA
ncbi:dihydroxyacetone kinase subunit L [Arsenicicoccus piscis]|uniref:Dihydroxyacetone kinase n=1 Tax=Arsenicicoccus piscis TaxID=673954 RepID=A0ABQ6HSP9_9MICO|nr:dihydroxyacetone kinase subunit DhaL [Arsenicicoccus piscis]MCH8627356.1 dihydroxyacetone kinase subunit L [Arsenicicoccus piscis]GMA21504.1 dihydroxyacetone kinase [Arsenicicoccus piscis]GMA22177.1 dihydroxyacetone kinase [Arsenicicoccus piscis]GMA22225.1 dihydroxyacetone kinase [Arsenicicoccus piscis]